MGMILSKIFLPRDQVRYAPASDPTEKLISVETVSKPKVQGNALPMRSATFEG